MRLLVSCTIVAVAFAWVIPSPAGADAAGDLYFEGFQAWKAGEALLAKGEAGPALKKLKEAEKKIAQVQTQFPEWQPEVVRYRLGAIRKKLAELTSSALPPDASPTDPSVLPVPSVKPDPMYLDRPMIPFIFNGEMYFKMLLASKQKEAAPVQP